MVLVGVVSSARPAARALAIATFIGMGVVVWAVGVVVGGFVVVGAFVGLVVVGVVSEVVVVVVVVLLVEVWALLLRLKRFLRKRRSLVMRSSRCSRGGLVVAGLVTGLSGGGLFFVLSPGVVGVFVFGVCVFSKLRGDSVLLILSGWGSVQLLAARADSGESLTAAAKYFSVVPWFSSKCARAHAILSLSVSAEGFVSPFGLAVRRFFLRRLGLRWFFGSG